MKTTIIGFLIGLVVGAVLTYFIIKWGMGNE
jgi:uncharacterized membrane protein